MGRGVAMHVQGKLNGRTFHICKEPDHYETDCPKYSYYKGKAVRIMSMK